MGGRVANMSKVESNPTEIKTVVDYIDAIITLTNDEKQKFIFRGQPSTRYDVSSGAYRVISETKKDGKVKAKILNDITSCFWSRHIKSTAMRKGSFLLLRLNYWRFCSTEEQRRG